MVTYVQDNSGINSLSGFSFQIRAFVYYMFMLEEGMQIEFETIDDVNIKKIKANEIDSHDEKFRSKIIGKGSNIAIQVKRTNLAESVVQKILLNWILLESSENVISKYILFTDNVYKNMDILFDKTAAEQFDLIIKSNKDSKAVITKVKKIYKDKFAEFEKIYNSIKGKYEFNSLEDINGKIEEGFAVHFRRAAVNEIVYFQRIKELIQHITVLIMENVNEKKSYICTYNDFIKIIEDISLRITEQVTLPLYADFKKLHPIDFYDLKIANSREYKQLLACQLSQFLIAQHLGFGMYYENLRYMYMESNRLGKIKDIEVTAYENFENVKFNLKKNSKDNPYNRLEETKKLGNSYADTDHIKYGSSIYLTKDEIEEYQISWEDEENAEPKT